MASLGVLGGTFDPPHLGHLVLAEAARVQFGLERVVFVPAGDPYHRRPDSGFQLASPRPDLSVAAVRLEMTRLAIAGNAAFALDDREILREGPSYTVDTLAELADERPGTALYLLLGADAAAELHRWKDPERIAQLATIAVAPRADRSTQPADRSWLPVDMPRFDVTSTLIRERVRAGLSIRYLVPDDVVDFVAAYRLYAPVE